MAEIQLRNLTKRWGAFIGVDNFNLTIADKEFLVMLGPSGCGKITTMRTMVRLEEATKGDIMIDGTGVNDVDSKDRDIVMVFQSYALYPDTTVYDNIRFPLMVRGGNKSSHEEKIRRASVRVELDDFLHRKPAELSGGKRQRVALAPGIVREPNVFLMDEPLSNLDAKLSVSARAQIKKLSHELAVTMIYVTHDQIEAMTLAGRVVIMKQGVVKQVGTPVEIYDTPANAFVASFIGNPAMNLIEGEINGGTFCAPDTEIKGLEALDGKVTLGFRAEDAIISDATIQINSRVNTQELLGDATMAPVRIGGARVSVKADKSYCTEIDQQISIWVPTKRCHMFDQETGASIGGKAPISLRFGGTKGCILRRCIHKWEKVRMKLLVKSVLLAGAISVVSVASFADGHACANDVPVKTISNAFPAYETMTGVMQACGNVESELDKDHRLKIVDAFSASPALYTMTSVTNSTAVPMLDADLLRPLDDLIAAHGQNLKPNQFVKIDGETMAIAAFANTQHLMYREDILSDLGIAVPTTWGEYIAAAEKIQAAGVVDYPIGHYMKDGWNLAFVFLNHYLGEGGEFFNDDWSPSINNEQGLAVLERMAKLATLMDPEYLVSDTTFVTKQLQQGKVAMANLWASRAGAVNDPAESSVAGKIIMAAGLRGSERIASTVWWDGWAIGKNISDAEAEAAMKLITASMAEDVIKEHNDDAIWLADGFVPSAAATGAFATVDGETADYPMNKYIGSMHAALGSGLAAFMTGDKDAATTLADIEAAYITDAKEKGLLD